MDAKTFSLVAGVIFAVVALFHLRGFSWSGLSSLGTGHYRCGRAGSPSLSLVALLFSG